VEKRTDMMQEFTCSAKLFIPPKNKKTSSTNLQKEKKQGISSTSLEVNIRKFSYSKQFKGF
jgi:hypothetical protein